MQSAPTTPVTAGPKDTAAATHPPENPQHKEQESEIQELKVINATLIKQLAAHQNVQEENTKLTKELNNALKEIIKLKDEALTKLNNKTISNETKLINKTFAPNSNDISPFSHLIQSSGQDVKSNNEEVMMLQEKIRKLEVELKKSQDNLKAFMLFGVHPQDIDKFKHLNVSATTTPSTFANTQFNAESFFGGSHPQN